MSIREKIEALIAELQKGNDFDDEFYQTYCLGLNDGDISDWANNHFDDNVELGFSTGEISMAHDMIIVLQNILDGKYE